MPALESILKLLSTAWQSASPELLRADDAPLDRIEPPLLALIHAHRDELAAALEDAQVADVARWFRRFAQTLDPFADVAPSRSTAIVDAVREGLEALRRALRSDDREALGGAYTASSRRLRAAIAGTLSARRPQTIASTYAPDLQLRVLGLDEGALEEPILDLGCGADAALVNLLRSRGKEAYGVDRVATPGPFVTEADFLEHPLPTATYGTIVSHLAFSTQLLHHELAQSPEAFRWARRYMEILRALRPGGLFAYVPGLPFLEQHLPASAFSVERLEIELPDALKPRDEAVRRAVPLYACHVRKLLSAR